MHSNRCPRQAALHPPPQERHGGGHHGGAAAQEGQHHDPTGAALLTSHSAPLALHALLLIALPTQSITTKRHHQPQVKPPADPCCCRWPEYCDSQQGALPPTRLQQLREQERSRQLELAGAAEGPPREHQQEQQQQNGDPSRGAAPPPPPAAGSATNRPGPPPPEAAHPPPPEAAEQLAERLESTYVHSVYDAIAPHFSATRFAIWPKVGFSLECRVGFGYLPVLGAFARVWIEQCGRSLEPPWVTHVLTPASDDIPPATSRSRPSWSPWPRGRRWPTSAAATASTSA
jgi:hypothetical protein